MNPAKQFLLSYRWLVTRRDDLLFAIERDYEHATKATSRIKAVMVSGTSSHDGLAEAVFRTVETKARLEKVCQEIDSKIALVLEAIESVSDERGKALLTKHYINGKSWFAIAKEMNYDRSTVYDVHGRALQEVEKYIRR